MARLFPSILNIRVDPSNKNIVYIFVFSSLEFFYTDFIESLSRFTAVQCLTYEILFIFERNHITRAVLRVSIFRIIFIISADKFGWRPCFLITYRSYCRFWHTAKVRPENSHTRMRPSNSISVNEFSKWRRLVYNRSARYQDTHLLPEYEYIQVRHTSLWLFHHRLPGHAHRK